MNKVSGALLHCCLWLLVALPAMAEPPGHLVTMWRMDGGRNHIYLLGSVHLLRAEDHPLPTVIDDAYADAGTLVMEMDLDAIDPAETQKLVSKLGLIQDGRTLTDLMGPALYAKAEGFAAAVNIPLALLAKSEPWLAAVTVDQLMLTRIGFDPKFGIENYLAAKAARDSKQIDGLETMQEQLEFLDNMSLESQRSLLLQTLEESAGIEGMMDDLIHAWRYGDVGFLQREMLDDIRQYPELYKTIVVNRNHNWLRKIEALLGKDGNYMVVVGSLHLIGDDGLPALLAEDGHKVVQLHETP